MKKLLSVLVILLLVAVLSACQATTDEPETANPVATITMANGEIMKLELFPEMAPETVNNFIDLANSEYYDGLTLHRTLKDALIQGGCPDGTGVGGPGYTIVGEFADNNFTANTLTHGVGTITMARTQSPNSAGSQFIILDNDYSQLDGMYAAFGQVIEGLDVLQSLTETATTDATDYYGNPAGIPVEPPVIASIRVDTKGITYNPPNKIIFVDDAPASDQPLPEVTLEMTDGSKIVLELYPQIAPNTVNNFISLIKSGFYDGLTFHRIIPGFMIQAGCPLGDGTGGPGYAIKGEFLDNGYFANMLKHTPGVLSMARANTGYDTAGSQFFIMDENYPSLDGQYAAFGKVIEGMDTVKAIVAIPLSDPAAGAPIEAPVIKKMTVDTKGIDYPEPEIIE